MAEINSKSKVILAKNQDNYNELVHMRENKLNTQRFDDRMEQIDDLFSSLMKRIQHDEKENKEIGEYILRYVPLLIQNSLFENLNSFLDYDQLIQLKEY